MKVRIIEDEKRIASFIRKGREAQRVVVEAAHHGEGGDACAWAHGRVLAQAGRTCFLQLLPSRLPIPQPEAIPAETR
jgi:hypothetical protein